MRDRLPVDVPFGSTRFGDLKRLSPIGHDFGEDRGTALDRYYIERFLAQNAADVFGRVLEVNVDDPRYPFATAARAMRQADS